MRPPDYNNPDAFGNFGRWPTPPRRRPRGPVAAVLALVLGVVIVGTFATLASAHSAMLSEKCSTEHPGVEEFTLDNSNSNGVLSIVSETGGVFTVGATLQPTGQAGHSITVTGSPSAVVSVHVTWTTDNRLPLGTLVGPVGPDTGCQGPTTTPSTNPPTTPSTAPPTTPSTAPPTTPTTAPTTTASTAPPSTPTTGPCDSKTPEETLPPQCFPTTTKPPAPPTTKVVCGPGLVTSSDDKGNVACLVPPATVTAPVPPSAIPAAPSFTG